MNRALQWAGTGPGGVWCGEAVWAEPLALGAKPSAGHGWVLVAERTVFLGEASWLEAHTHIAWARWEPSTWWSVNVNPDPGERQPRDQLFGHCACVKALSAHPRPCHLHSSPVFS